MIHKKINNLFNYYGINIFFPVYDFIFENYNDKDGVLLFNRIFKIISIRIKELHETSRNQFFKMLSCFLKNFNRCFLEENEVLNNFF